jgi:hypothetical protein
MPNLCRPQRHKIQYVKFAKIRLQFSPTKTYFGISSMWHIFPRIELTRCAILLFVNKSLENIIQFLIIQMCDCTCDGEFDKIFCHIFWTRTQKIFTLLILIFFVLLKLFSSCKKRLKLKNYNRVIQKFKNIIKLYFSYDSFT